MRMGPLSAAEAGRSTANDTAPQQRIARSQAARRHQRVATVSGITRSPPATEMSRQRRKVDVIYHEGYTVNPLRRYPDARVPSAVAHRHLPEAARGDSRLRASARRR